ncbi:MAG: class I SAM-dependent methyltransferase [Mesorhizobium sp.]|uniref:class I SAM-dependent methyltransferase n=1 Tax=Mesorhizobium sp. TaxID=1871066 RepID=UPI000FEA6B12|nr:class I SAM-dependent methyltransferase [Mesorhizobium sp.]RWP93217.1 MAG: class I SAM-dependent methyltransferase [Mesorhizobium sp.]
MQIDKLAAMWQGYRQRGVIPTIHLDDGMFKGNPFLDDYDIVGESVLNVIVSILAIARKEAIYNIMDFGCGHGRGARYIRSLFPAAKITFCDIDPSCVEFCAHEFGGDAVLSSEHPSDIKIPGGMDLIWVGSVFTHVDYERMQILFDKLFAALGRGGILIATFRGHNTYEITKNDPIQAAAQAQMLKDYEQTGTGYWPYPNAAGQVGMSDWGLSLASIERVVALGKRHANARLVGYSESGWANVHDVGAWTKR